MGYQLSWRVRQTSLGKSTVFLSIYLLHLLCNIFGSMDFILFCRLIQCYLAFYEVRVPRDPKFAARFLRIPCHHGHPCVKLTTTTAFVAQDFHPIDYTHARRTKRSRPNIFRPASFDLRHLLSSKYEFIQCLETILVSR
jgi:hypothetical protein